jgi:hypothetical protein
LAKALAALQEDWRTHEASGTVLRQSDGAIVELKPLDLLTSGPLYDPEKKHVPIKNCHLVYNEKDGGKIAVVTWTRVSGAQVETTHGLYDTMQEAGSVAASIPQVKMQALARVRDMWGGDQLTSEEAEEQATAEGLTLKRSTNATGFMYVRRMPNSTEKPYGIQMRLEKGGKEVWRTSEFGTFATAEHAALVLAREAAGLPLSG